MRARVFEWIVGAVVAHMYICGMAAAQTYTWPENGHTYKLISTTTWSSAQSTAVSLGGNLVTVNNAAEQAMLQSVFTTSSEFWIGFNDYSSEGTFVWVSGETPSYTNWGNGEPNNQLNEDGGVLQRWNSGYWNDYGGEVHGMAEIECDVDVELFLEDNIEVNDSREYDRTQAIYVSNGTSDYFKVGATGTLTLESEVNIGFRNGFAVATGGVLAASIVGTSSCGT